MYRFFSSVLAISFVASTASIANAGSITQALKTGKAYGDFRLRYETVEQDNPVDDATALTLRSRLGYNTGKFNGFSATLEVEDSRIVAGQDEFTVGPTGFNLGEYSVIADPETTEVDQMFIKYVNREFSATVGRQVFTLDGHRFVGHVGWRQDRQVFDAAKFVYAKQGLTATYAYINQRERIFAEEADINSKDHILNVSYKTKPGVITGYAYLLEVDNDTDNALDTYGASFKGATNAGDTKINYAIEYATQSAESGAADFDADYLLLEVGATFSGVSAALGYEVLGSDDGNFGFSTPLATLHKFNGWADQFLATPAQGLVDVYLRLGGKVAGGKWAFVYHDFSADDSTPGVDDLGDEINLLYARPINKTFSAGIKYAAYSAGDIKVDADKLWVWVGAKF